MLVLGTRLVVLRRDDRPDLPWPDHLDLPGGGLEPGEDAAACVLREVREELGLTLDREALVSAGIRDSPMGGSAYFTLFGDAGLGRQIRFGAEGQGWCLMQPARFAEHPDAIPHLASLVRDVLCAENK